MTGAPSRTIAVIGAGYVGLTTAACLSSLGHQVTAADVDADKVARLGRGELPILEEGLGALVEAGLGSGALRFTTDAAAAVVGAELVFLCVPTPQGPDGSADLRHVEAAAHQISKHLVLGSVVVTKSTVPVGSAAIVEAALARPDVAVVSNPEFLREGCAVDDWLHPDRVVIGATDEEAAARLAQLYEPLGAPVVVTDPVSAETVKYACNAFLATKVSFVNAVANLCQAVGADVRDVLLGMSHDSRIGADHLSPGPGWGGSCLPKDTAALIRIASDHGYDFALLKEVIAANEAQFDHVVDRVEVAVGGILAGARVGVWGLTFKAGTDDLRESPALSVLRRLAARGAVLRAYDPTRPDPGDAHLAGLGLEIADHPLAACEGADVLVVLTEWPELAEVDLAKVAAIMESPAVVDTRNILDPAAVRAAGCRYEGMGRL